LSTALSMIRPRWTDDAWEETATPDELQARMPTPEQELAQIDAELRRMFEDAQFEAWLGVPAGETQATQGVAAMKSLPDDAGASRKSVLTARRVEIMDLLQEGG